MSHLSGANDDVRPRREERQVGCHRRAGVTETGDTLLCAFRHPSATCSDIHNDDNRLDLWNFHASTTRAVVFSSVEDYYAAATSVPASSGGPTD